MLLDLNSGMQLLGRGRLGGGELLHPLAARLALVLLEAAGGGLQHRAEDGARITDQPEVDVAVLADGAVVHVDLHELELLADAPAVAHAKIKRRADDDDDVGIGERVASACDRNGADRPAATARGCRR